MSLCLLLFVLTQKVTKKVNRTAEAESSMLPPTKAYAHPLNFQANALKINTLKNIFKNSNKHLIEKYPMILK
jgi:hypothetical protein